MPTERNKTVPIILIVLALLRQALATPQLPPGQVLMGLSLFMMTTSR